MKRRSILSLLASGVALSGGSTRAEALPSACRTLPADREAIEPRGLITPDQGYENMGAELFRVLPTGAPSSEVLHQIPLALRHFLGYLYLIVDVNLGPRPAAFM
jgi:hypothetical protein